MIRYTARFATRDGSVREVVIADALPDDGSAPVELTLAAEGVRLEVSTDEDPLIPLRPTTGVLPIVVEEGQEYSHLSSGAAYSLTVLITHGGLVDFGGYVSPEVLTAQWPPVGSVMPLAIVCPLEKLNGERLEVTAADFSTIRRLLWECLYPHGIAPLSSEYAVTWPMGQSVETGDASGGSVLELRVARALFYEKDTDAEGRDVTRGKPLADVLAEILRALGLCLTIDGRTVRIFRAGQAKYRRTRIDFAELYTPIGSPLEPQPLPTDGWRYLGNGHTTSRYRGARRVEVTAEHSRWGDYLFDLGNLNFAPVADERVFLNSTLKNDGVTAIRAYHNESTDGSFRTYPNADPATWVGSGGVIADYGRYTINSLTGLVEKLTTFHANNVGGSFPAHAVRVYEGGALPVYADFTPAIACVTNTYPVAGPPTQRDESLPLFRYRSADPVVLSGGALLFTASLGAVHTDRYTLLAPVTGGYGKLRLFLRIGDYVWRGASWEKNSTLVDSAETAVEVPMVADDVDRERASAPAGFEHAEGYAGERARTTRGGGFAVDPAKVARRSDDKSAYIPLRTAVDITADPSTRRRAYVYPELRAGGYVTMSLYFVSASAAKRGEMGEMLVTDVTLSYREPDTSWGFSGDPQAKSRRTLAHDTTTGQTGDTYELTMVMHSDHTTARGAYSTILHGAETLRTWYDNGEPTTLEASRLRDAVAHQDRVREYRDVQIEQNGSTPPHVGRLVSLEGRTWVVLSRSALFATGTHRLLLLDLPNT